MPRQDPTPEPIPGHRFVEAIAHTVELHAGQAWEATAIPYVSHLLTQHR